MISEIEEMGVLESRRVEYQRSSIIKGMIRFVKNTITVVTARIKRVMQVSFLRDFSIKK